MERPARRPKRPRRSRDKARRSCHALSTVEQRDTPFSAEASRALGGPSWLARRRAAAFERFAAASLPTGDEEIWRYSRVAELDLARYSPAPKPASGPMVSLPRQAHGLIDRIGERAGLVLAVDGHVVEADLAEEGERSGVRLAAVSSHPAAEGLLGRARSGFAGEERDDAFDDLAEAFQQDGVVVNIPAAVELSRPIVIVNVLGGDHDAEAEGPALFPLTVVSLGENAGASVVELCCSGTGAILSLPVVELSVGDGARLSYSLVQQLGRRTWQLGHGFARAGRDSHLKWFTASLGGEYARSRTDSLLDGQGGEAELLAAYLGDGSQVHDFRTLQEHVGARTTSDLLFKGAVADVARSVYSGMIRMRHGARGANAFQTNRNLVLSEGAHAHSVPNLDIEENDVRCSHASAVGPIDAEQRFYLQSRGVPSQVAERLILLGFFDDLLDRGEPAVRDHVAAHVRERARAVTAELAS